VSGHLFIVHGDVLGVACDAVLIPSGTGVDATGRTRPGHVTGGWTSILGSALEDGFLSEAPDTTRRVTLVVEGGGIVKPALWAGFTGDRGDEGLGFFQRTVSAFAHEAGAHARAHRTSRDARPLMSARPLLALPLIGSGAGGRAGDKGGLLLGLVKALTSAASEEDVDIALVLSTETAYAAAQQARSLLDRSRAWGELDEKHDAEALRLAELARARRLVLFLGAGASMGAGLPSWSDLLKRLAERARLTEAEQQELAHLEHRDAGRVLDLRLKDLGGLATAVVDETAATRAALLHQLVASLPVTEAVTTNYDQLFEHAWTAADRAHRVLPWEADADERAWLLKLHGSVHHPGSIVLSRDDYLRFEGEGVALAGIVQAMLLTRHMLFVGYSLSDDNFHRLVHQVRTAIGVPGVPSDAHFGTVLTPRAPRLGDDLWRGNVRFITTADADGKDDPRQVAIMVDRIGALAAAPAAHVLDDSYAALFTPAQRELRERLIDLWQVLDRDDLDAGTRVVVRGALEQIGRPARRGGAA